MSLLFTICHYYSHFCHYDPLFVTIIHFQSLSVPFSHLYPLLVIFGHYMVHQQSLLVASISHFGSLLFTLSHFVIIISHYQSRVSMYLPPAWMALGLAASLLLNTGSLEAAHAWNCRKCSHSASCCCPYSHLKVVT